VTLEAWENEQERHIEYRWLRDYDWAEANEQHAVERERFGWAQTVLGSVPCEECGRELVTPRRWPHCAGGCG
jgi:hypothetical protein